MFSFELEEGTIFGFLGPNGPGKTTTINILCTLLSPTSGKAYINGYDCDRESPKVRNAIGIVFQDSSLDKDLTARENLMFHAYLYGVGKADRKQRIEEIIGHLRVGRPRRAFPERRHGGFDFLMNTQRTI